MSINITTPYSARPDLNDAYYQYQVNEDNYIATRLFKPLAVDSVKGEIEVVKGTDMITPMASMARAGNGTYNRIDAELDVISYELGEKGAEHVVKFGEQNTIQYNKILGGIRLLKAKRYIARETDAAYVMNNSSIPNSTLVGTTWDSTAAEPIVDLIKARDEVITACGQAPDTIVMNAFDFSLLIKTEQVRDSFPGVAVLSYNLVKEALPDLAGYSKLLISNAMNNTGPIFANGKIFVCKTADSADDPAEIPATGRLLYWAEDAGYDGVVEDYLSNEQRALIIRIRDYQNPLVLNAKSAAYLTVRT